MVPQPADEVIEGFLEPIDIAYQYQALASKYVATSVDVWTASGGWDSYMMAAMMPHAGRSQVKDASQLVSE